MNLFTRENRLPLISRNGRKLLIMDVVILLLVILATNILAGYLIPYINATYQLTADSVDVGSLDLFSSLFSGTPSEWFSTQIEGYELPQYRWYIALAIAWMIQTIANDLSSYICFPNIRLGGRIGNFAISELVSNFVVSAVFSAFMLQMTNFFIITVCPQDIPVLIMLAEILLFCLPALIHRILSRPEFSWKSIVFRCVSILILFLMTRWGSVILQILLIVVNFVPGLLGSTDDEAEAKATVRLFAVNICAILVTACWISAGVALIRPVVYTHMPTVEQTVEEVYCTDAAYGDSGYSMFLRTDGCAVDAGNHVLGENIEQLAVCGYNAFLLSGDHVLYVTDGENTIPTAVKEHIVWISCYLDRLLAIDEDGNVLGFGDFGNYLPGEPCYDDFTVIVSGYKFVQGDIGEEHILLVDENGNLYSMGCNSSGELGTGSQSLEPQTLTRIMTGVSSVRAGLGTSYALTTEGKIYAWGRNDATQLGFEARKTAVTTPQELVGVDGITFTGLAVGAECAFAIDSDHNLWAWGRGVRSTDTKPVILLADILKAADIKFLQSGTNAQQLMYLVDMDNTARRATLSSSDNFDIRDTEIIIDTSDWMPEPIEEINTALESFLEKLGIISNLAEEEVEETEEEPEPSELYIPGNESHAVSWYRSFNGHRYRIFNECMGMEDAERYCELMGGHLATVTTEDELYFINDILNEEAESRRSLNVYHYHIGLYYDGSFQWITGEDTSLVRSISEIPIIKDDGEGIFDRSDDKPEMLVGAGQSLPFICEWDTEYMEASEVQS